MQAVSESIKTKLYILANMLMVVFGFILFMDHRMSKRVLLVILLIWIITGDYKVKIKKIISNPIAVTFLVFIGIFILGLLWTEDLHAGGNILKRPLLYLIVPLMVSMYDKKFLKYYLFAMIGAITYTSILTILIHYELLEMTYNIDESPYIHRVYLAGMLIFIYSYLLSKMHFTNSLKLNLALSVAVALVVYTLIIGGSRMGYINMFIATLVVLLYKYKFKRAYLLGIIVFIMTSSYAVYSLSPKVKEEVNRTIEVIKHMDLKSQILRHDTSKRTSLTCRFEFWYYAFEMGKENFPLGVGTGDGIVELERHIGEKETDALFEYCLGDGTGQFNPHNMYLFMFMQFGLLGILILLWMLYVHATQAVKSESISLVVLVLTTILALISLSELFSSKFFIPFYGYAIIVMYLISQESHEDKNLIVWR
jgi:hypothetical protein